MSPRPFLAWYFSSKTIVVLGTLAAKGSTLMETLTLIFVIGMFLAAILVTLIVRRDFTSQKTFERNHPISPKIRRR